jgi:hypothetical protein
MSSPITRLKPISWFPRISMGLTIAQLSPRLRCAERGGQVYSEFIARSACRCEKRYEGRMLFRSEWTYGKELLSARG